MQNSTTMPPKPRFRVSLRGDGLLTSPRFNKGTAFTLAERKAFGLIGRLPSRVNTIDDQCKRHESPIRKNSFMQSLKDQNWVLYYTLLERNLKELVPIIYTPTEADAIANYSHLFRRSEGLYLTFPDQDSMEADFLEQIKGREIDLVVCTDAEAILGIGIRRGISSAKSVIYTSIGGLDPSKSLSVVLDVGTNNQGLLDDPLYVVRMARKRIRGEEYDKFIDKFVQLIRKHLPNSLLHFEDFGVTNAQRLLQRYRDSHAVFNDDIQGTGAVTLACVMAAIGVAKTGPLSNQRYVIYGAGSAGLGITHQLRDAMVTTDGITRAEANKRFWLVDRDGLIVQNTKDKRNGWDEFSRDGDGIGLLETVKTVKPTVLVGCSTHAGAFTEDVVRSMAAGCDRPIILPLSNPSKLVEVHPKDANEWTNGKALVATGSPFESVKMGGKEFIIAECNNALIYPGLGFGSMLSQSRNMTDTMIIAGAQRLASLAPALKNPDYALLPDIGDAPGVNFEVAVAVAECAVEEGSAGGPWAEGKKGWRKEDVRERAREKVWRPVYGEYVYDEAGDR
ncbi:hypothetical protein BD779DRAFT_1488646 [Infundibulicybe gibba]|nr:hypothetical protein BD779DRAFT_1488646 [Infundibulicybe gibba]